MDERIAKIIVDELGEHDYEVICKMLEVMDGTTKGVKEELERILGEAVDEG